MNKKTPAHSQHNVVLDEYEQELEDNLEFCIRLSPEEEKLEIAKLISAAKNHSKAKKSITLRVSPYDLEIMRLKASKLGIPYQTYINMVIHKDASVL